MSKIGYQYRPCRYQKAKKRNTVNAKIHTFDNIDKMDLFFEKLYHKSSKIKQII